MSTFQTFGRSHYVAALKISGDRPKQVFYEFPNLRLDCTFLLNEKLNGSHDILHQHIDYEFRPLLRRISLTVLIRIARPDL
ncbi:MAG: hypothetical protein WA999_12650 [Spirulinaceae cyanobacterium]